MEEKARIFTYIRNILIILSHIKSKNIVTELFIGLMLKVTL